MGRYASMPFDNVKTRMQSIGNTERRMISVASQMLASEGVLVFWRATTPRLVRLTASFISHSQNLECTAYSTSSSRVVSHSWSTTIQSGCSVYSP